MNNQWTIIYCSDHHGNFIHEEHLNKSNPNAQILKLDFKNNYPTHIIWKQCDLVVRPWLKSNINNIKHNNVAIIEYDVLINKELPDIHLNNAILGNKVNYPETDDWWVFFNDKHNLKHLEQHACALLFFCFYMMSRNCIEYWIDSKYDFLYNNVDIICEMRVPTILKHNGVNIKEADSEITKNIKLGENIEFDTNIPGFYHPIKNPI